MFVEHFSVPQNTSVVPIGYDPLVSMLQPFDQAEYFRLAHFFAFADDRNKRNLGMSTFIKHLNLIHNFICKGDMRDAQRGLICGIQFGNNSLLINTSRLKKLMCRSKSCMNGCFQKLGYMSSKPSQDLSSLLCRITPGIMVEALNPRNWCVRKAGEKCTLFNPNILLDMAHRSHDDVGNSSGSSNSSASEEETQRVRFSFDISDLLNHHPK